MSIAPHHPEPDSLAIEDGAGPSTVRLARLAMATRFEIVLHGENTASLRAAGEEALDEVERLEERLSLYRASSEIAHLNACAHLAPVRVTPALFALLQHARQLHDESGKAFDITAAPLVRCWGFMDENPRIPAPQELAGARAKVGMHLVELDPKNFTVRFAREGVMLDLGAIGKGYAIERAAELLREAGVTSALLHAGTSTVYGLGSPSQAESWKIAIPHPPISDALQDTGPGVAMERRSGGEFGAFAGVLATVSLRDEALSVSAVWGKCFRVGSNTFGHVLDPRTGEPAAAALLAAVVLPSAQETDALSTALLTRGAEGHEAIARLRPGMRTLLAVDRAGKLRVEARGFEVIPQELWDKKSN